jgi:Meiotically up-regulated gene 113
MEGAPQPSQRLPRTSSNGVDWGKRTIRFWATKIPGASRRRSPAIPLAIGDFLGRLLVGGGAGMPQLGDVADVEIVATYELYNINRARLENLIHRVFDPARLDIEIKDRFGQPITPREWFLVPLFVIDEAIERIRDGTIVGYSYDPKTASLACAVRPPLPDTDRGRDRRPPSAGGK